MSSSAINPSNESPAHRYDATLAGKIETRWQHAWAQQKTYEVANPGEPGFDASCPKFYCLDMFPYPSGAGLHIGHPEGYTATDIVSRYKRMQGFNVLHPMGWDAFGLPAEQYAIQTGVHPAITTKQAIDNFRRQLQRFGFSYDWSREFGTIDDGYYKWTQWIFVKLYEAYFEEARERESEGAKEGKQSAIPVSRTPGCAQPISKLEAAFASGARKVKFNPRADEVSESDRARELGPWASLDAATKRRVIDSYRLAYQSTTTVNWCPKLGTVLANDEVIDGKSERGGYPVLRKPLKQWMFRITAYADRLIEQLEGLDWPSSTKAMQREWIGKSEGAEVDFAVGRLSEPTSSPSTRASDVQVRDVSLPAGRSRQATHPADSLQRFIATFEHFVACDPYPKGEPSPDGLIAQVRNLPHLELPDATYFVTFGTNGWHLNDEGKSIVLKALMYFDGERCDVVAACVMSNHVHWLVKPRGENSIRELTASVKRFSATQVNKLENMTGSLWQPDSFDHIVRDERWLGAFVRYIARNPVEAKLVTHVREYPWTYVSESVRSGTQSLGIMGVNVDRPFGTASSASSVAQANAARGAAYVQDINSSQAVGKGLQGSTSGAREAEVGVGSESRRTSLRVFTTRPDTLFGATYMVVAPEHPLCGAVLAGEYAVDGATRDALQQYVSWARNRSDVERQESKDKTGAFTGLFATNPVNGNKIPIWTSDYVMMGYGTGAIMAVPAHDERDFEFASKFGLEIKQVVRPPHAERGGTQGDKQAEFTCFAGEGIAINSSTRDGSFTLDGLATHEAKQRIIAWLEQQGVGTKRTNYKLRDWTFSRQRYWGEPFPIVYDDAGNAYPIMESHLPVKLPELADYAPVESDDPQPLLAKAKDWVRTTAGAAGVSPALLHPATPVTRETNTMPGSAGSSWYAIRYCDPHNNSQLVSKEAEQYWMGGDLGSPTLRVGSSANAAGNTAHNTSNAVHGTGVSSGVDLYLGGSEHAVGHLLYSRFWQNVLFDLGFVACKEPFRKLFHQGLITSFAYQRADKSIVPVDEVQEVSEGADVVKYIEIATGKAVSPIVTKMSKRYKNVVNPDDVINEFGADTCRLYEMYMGPLEASKPWNPRDIVGCYRFLQRAWRVCVDEATGDLKMLDAPGSESRVTQAAQQDLEKLLHRLIKKVGGDIEGMSFNTAIAAMIEFVNAATTAASAGQLLTRSQVERFMLVLQPFAPHLAQEVWSKLGHNTMIAHAAWPKFDEGLLVDSEIELPVSVNGKVRTRIMVPMDAAKDAKALEAFARAHADVIAAIGGKEVKKMIVVPGKMVNLVIA